MRDGMKYNNIGEAKTLTEYITEKRRLFNASDRKFASLYPMMFSEENNVIFEENDGYKIKKTTYGQCKANAEQRAYSLREALKAEKKGSVVGIFLNNGKEWVEVFWATLICGFKPLLLNMRLDDDTLEKALGDLGAIAVVSVGKVFKIKTLTLDDLALTGHSYLSKEFGDELFVMSSGTSNNVKICAYSEKEVFAILGNSFGINRRCKLMKKHYRGELKLLTLLPFYHIFGLVAVYLWFAFYGRTFVSLRDFSPETIIDTIRRHKVTHIFAVPLFWQRVYDEAMKSIRLRGEDTYRKFEKALHLSDSLGFSVLGRAFARRAFKEVRDNLFGDSVSFMISGGSMIKPKVLEFFNGIGYRLANGYGMSEIGITSVELSDDRKVLTSASIGEALDSVEYKLENGELLVKGDSRAKYIIENGKATPLPEWFKTGDLLVCENGHYYVQGRKDDLIVSMTGENLNPNLIESKFDFPRIKELCLINGEGALPILLVYVGKYLGAANMKATEDYVRARIAELNLTSQIGKIAFTTTPLMADGDIKPNRKRIAADYAAGAFKLLGGEGREEEGNFGEIEHKVREFFALSLGKDTDEVGFETDFFLDEGGTSLDYMAMISHLNHEFGVDIPDLDGALTSVVSISDYIKTKV